MFDDCDRLEHMIDHEDKLIINHLSRRAVIRRAMRAYLHDTTMCYTHNMMKGTKNKMGEVRE
jgi:hypothetical protein